jgi:cyclopropane fatty-acyl-phospholipid synthase-like methyltransferase
VVSPEYQDIRTSLLLTYDNAAGRRDQQVKQPWKLAERDRFLGRLRAEQCTRLLEIGAGTGQDSVFFAGHGLDVVATDMSPEMVARCRN